MSTRPMRSFYNVLLLAFVAMVWPASTSAQAAQDAPTFNADVGRILYDNCAMCHREGEIAPMVLTSYKAARPWARAIKTKVVSREMPPWFADPRYGHFQDVLAMSQAEIDTIAAWVDAGAPEGTGPAPDVPEFSSDWRHDRPPDYVVEMPLEIELPAQGEIDYVEVWMENPRKEDVYLEAVQMRPGNSAVVHHGGIFTRPLPHGTKLGEEQLYPGGQLVPQPVPIDPNEGPEVKLARAEEALNGLTGDAQLIFYRPGGGYNKYPEGTAKRVYGDRHLMFNMHYALTGRPEIDRSSAGFWFSKEPPHHQVLTVGSGELGGSGTVRIVENTEQFGAAAFAKVATSPRIPPHADDFKVTGIWPVTDDVTIYGVWPHMHFRGKDMTYVISYPDGTEQTVLNVPNYDFNWQLEYDFVEPLKVPAGSTIKTIGHFDNSVKNRYNPSPDAEVHWGLQSWDEMFFIFTKFTVDKNVLSLEN